ARGVVRQHLVYDDQLGVQQAELQLGVGYDYSPGQGVFSRRAVDTQGGFPQAFRDAAPYDVAHLLEGDVLVVARLGFGGRGEDRLRQLLALLQARRQGYTGYAASLLVFGPARSGQVATRHALY